MVFVIAATMVFEYAYIRREPTKGNIARFTQKTEKENSAQR